jgi:hypothetical protein
VEVFHIVYRNERRRSHAEIAEDAEKRKYFSFDWLCALCGLCVRLPILAASG